MLKEPHLVENSLTIAAFGLCSELSVSAVDKLSNSQAKSISGKSSLQFQPDAI